jgi:hypothetical protein
MPANSITQEPESLDDCFKLLRNDPNYCRNSFYLGAASMYALLSAAAQDALDRRNLNVVPIDPVLERVQDLHAELSEFLQHTRGMFEQ